MHKFCLKKMEFCTPYPLNPDCPRGLRGEQGDQGNIGEGVLGPQGDVGPQGSPGPAAESFGDFFVSGEPGTIFTTTQLDGSTVPIDGSVISEEFSAGLFTSTGTGSFTYVGTEPTSWLSVGLTMNLSILNMDVDDTQVFKFTAVLLRNGAPTDASSTHEWFYEFHDNQTMTVAVDAIIPNNTSDVYTLGLETIYIDGSFGAAIDPDDPMLEVISYTFSGHVIA